MLIDLRAHLYIVTVNISTGDALIRSSGEHTLQSVAELMESSLNLIDSEESGSVA